MEHKYEPMFRLRLKRIEKFMSQEKLAELVGVSQGDISNYELGKSFPRKKTLDKIAKVLECAIRDIV